MSIVKRGSYGFGFGYGKSKPVINYHTTNSDSVTTVVAEISRLSVNEKPPCTTGAAVQNYTTLEEVCEEKVGGYSAHHGGAVEKHSYGEQKAYQYGTGVGGYGESTGAALKHGYGEQKTSYQHGVGAGGYGAPHHNSTGAALKHGYGEQKASYQHGVDAGGYGAPHHDGTGSVQKHGYGEHQAYQYGGDVKGYTALHHESMVEKHGYGGQKAYQHGSDVVGGYGHNSSYGAGQKAYQHGSDAGAYGAIPHDTKVQKHGYGEQKAYQHGNGAGGYGALHHDSATQKHGYGEKVYQHGGAAGGYGAIHHDSATQKHGYGEKVYQHGGNAGGYGALHHDTATQKHGAYGGHNEYQHAGDGYGEHKAYQQGCVDGVAGYDGFVQKSSAQKQYGYGGGHKTTYDNAMQKQKHGYGGGQYAAYQPGCDDVAGYDALVINKAMQKQAATETYKHWIASKESDCSSDEESDGEEELAYGGKHAAAGNKLGTTHQYSAYQQDGDGGHYESYQSTTTQGYSGGGYGGLAQPRYF